MYNWVMNWIWTWPAIVGVISLVFSSGLTIWSRRKDSKQRDEDRKIAEKQRAEDLSIVEKQRAEDNAHWREEISFARGNSELILSSTINEKELRPLRMFNLERDKYREALFSVLRLKQQSGWLREIRPIISCFKNKNQIFVDMSQHISVVDTVSFDKESQEKYSSEFANLYFRREGNTVTVFNSQAIQFYPEEHPDSFYYFFLVSGTGNKSFLYMLGGDTRPDGQLAPFLLSKPDILGTVATVNADFKREYIELVKYLSSNGYQIY